MRTFEKSAVCPMTDSQKGVYLECISAPDSLRYNVPMLCCFSRKVDAQRLIAAVKTVVHSHGALHMIACTPDGVPSLRYQEREIVVVEKAVADVEEEIAAFIRPFDLENEPLCRFELLPSLCFGKTVCIATEDEIHDPIALRDLMLANNVGMMTATPSFMNNMLTMPGFDKALLQLKTLVVGAEAFLPSLYGALRTAAPDLQIINGYGPTECTVCRSVKELHSGEVTMLLMSEGIEAKYGDIFDHPTPEGLAEFIEQRDGVKDAPQSAEIRLRTMLIYYFSNSFEDAIRDRITLLEADITDASLADVLASVPFDTVINCAACVKHFSDSDILEQSNVHGVENLIDICMKKNAKLVQIFTVSVPGIHTKESYEKQIRMHEDELFVIDDMDNKYGISKYHAELKMLDAIDRGLRGKIIRCGNLMGRHSDGEFQANLETNMFMSGIRGFATMGKYPISHMTDPMRFSPVDCTARVNARLHGLAAYDIKDAHAVDTDNLFTTNVLYRIGFSWPLVDDAYLDRAIHSLLTMDYFAMDELDED